MSSFLYRSNARRKLFNQFHMPLKNNKQVAEVLENNGKLPEISDNKQLIYTIVGILIVFAIITVLVLWAS